jgi:hypothetical protein
MVNNRNYTNKHNIHVLLIAKVDTKRLGNSGIIFYRTDPLGGNAHVAQSLPSIIVKSTELHGIVITTFGNVKSVTIFSFIRINFFSTQLTCL